MLTLNEISINPIHKTKSESKKYSLTTKLDAKIYN